MPVRMLKIVLVGFVALMALVYALQNIVNLDAAYAFVGTVLSMAGHSAYPDSLFPEVTSPALVWLALLVILAGEFSVAILAGLGAFRLWNARSGPARDFNAAKGAAVLGCGMALVVWFGLFAVIGGAVFQMWQTEIGAASLEGALQVSAVPGLILLFLNQDDR